MFKTRLISGIVLVVIALAVILTGGDLLLAVTALISVIGMFELYRVFQIEKSPVAVCGYLTAIVYYGNLRLGITDTVLISIVFLILLLAVYVFSYPKYRADQIMAGFFALFYVAMMLSYIYQTRTALVGGMYVVWLIFLCSWGSDTCAYCAGMLFGKHKMSPVLSPKKSIEGAVGGVVGAALLTALYSYIFRDAMGLSSLEILLLALTGAVGALISMVGDLAASAIKRNYDIKDYGKLIPGHGGILDRFDSVIITAPIIYYLASYIVL
jgi:phosphatidate cytidylyltransferase